MWEHEGMAWPEYKTFSLLQQANIIPNYTMKFIIEMGINVTWHPSHPLLSSPPSIKIAFMHVPFENLPVHRKYSIHSNSTLVSNPEKN